MVNEVAKIIVVGLLLSDVVEFAWAQTGSSFFNNYRRY
jgi:hypothetical protein